MNANPEASDVLAVIPARSGSKRLPGKNLRLLAGKPLIAYSIRDALDSGCVGRVVVSTDAEEIAAVARAWGADAPFLRPAELARDETPTLSVLRHVLAELEAREGYRPELVVLLQPTSPLRGPQIIRESVSKMADPRVDSVVSVCLEEHSPYLLRRLVGERVVPFLDVDPLVEGLRRQDLPPIYRLNGAVYFYRCQRLTGDDPYGAEVRGVVMPAWRSVDIDREEDLLVAEVYLRRFGATAGEGC